MEDLRDEVRRRYAAAASGALAGGGCCGGEQAVDIQDGSGLPLYEGQSVPDGVVAMSLGCGNPTAVADLSPGEVVLDLGSGAGLDVLLAARRVAPGGIAYGLDMTDEMLALARANAEAAGVEGAVFIKGYIEDIPLPDGEVDVVISNCVINLSTDEPAVFAEIARVVRPGGRLAITDIVADDDLTPAQRVERGSYVGCIAGALSFSEYRELLEAAGFEQIEIVVTHAVADRMHSAIVRAVRAAR